MENRDFTNELKYTATRSSGPGGQHVNKVSTRIELRFDIAGSLLLTEEEKGILLEKLANRITGEGVLILVSQTERSQQGNREKVTERFYRLIAAALKPVRKRKATRPSAASVEERLDLKRRRAETKERRKKPL
jgi:ribosome-associated protein